MYATNTTDISNGANNNTDNHICPRHEDDASSNDVTTQTNTSFTEVTVKARKRKRHAPLQSSATLSRPLPSRSASTPWRTWEGRAGRYEFEHGTGSVEYIPDFLDRAEADTLLSVVKDCPSWSRQSIYLFGKAIPEPRDVILFGTAEYTYSKMSRTPVGWGDDMPSSQLVHDLGQRIARRLGLDDEEFFNAVLANKYYHGRDFMGWHADDEESLGPEPLIAALSVGVERRFMVRRKKSWSLPIEKDTWERMEYKLGHGSLIVMSGKMQQYYQHCIPKTALSKCNDVRINLSFRRVVQ